MGINPPNIVLGQLITLAKHIYSIILFQIQDGGQNGRQNGQIEDKVIVFPEI